MDSIPSQSAGRSSISSSSASPSKSISFSESASTKSGSDPSWVGWWSSSTSISLPEFTPIASKPSPDLTRSDFQSYLSSISEPYQRFDHIRIHASNESAPDSHTGPASEDEKNAAIGDALVACLREVPALYFKEDFALEEGATFRAACPFHNVAENLVLQEKLSHYLDIVELHLVKEISLRSDSFFEAQVQLQDLNSKIVQGCSRIRELQETIRLLENDLVDPARRIREFNAARGNLLGLQQKLRLIYSVNQALSALKLLVASADCAGALDIIDDLRHLLAGEELTGLHCFRHLRDHVAASVDSINSILSAEFMRASVHDVGDGDAIILGKAKSRASVHANGAEDEQVKFDEEEMSNFRDRLLPVVIGLLRTAKLPSVLRMYRDMLTADMKTAIKTTVADLLPILVAKPSDLDFTPGERLADGDGGSSSLASKLRGLSSESFVQLLSAIFMIVRVHLVRASEVKKAIEWIMCNLDDHYAANSVAAAIALGAAAAESGQENDGQVASLISHSAEGAAIKLPSFQGRMSDSSNSSIVSKNFRADVLRENAEAVFAACDAAHGRWAKLLGVRALLHPRLRLQEFLSIYSITQEFISATEKIGGRLGYSIRGTLQSQAKSFVDFQHESRMGKMKAVLDQEQWGEVDVPDEFQAIINSIFVEEPAESDASQVSGVLVGNGPDEFQSNLEENQQPSSSNIPEDNLGQAKSSSTDGTIAKEKSDHTNSSSQANSTSIRERKKSSTQSLLFRGVGYHMVNCGLILVKMLSEYIDMNNFLPALSSEVVLRVVELLKHFNTRTCQLVLGAQAMQVSGLKSITSKHLALASQVISFVHAVIPEIKHILFMKVPDTRKALLLLEIDRVAQDYKVHQDEIHSKLIQIMRERLLFHLRQLPSTIQNWNKADNADTEPSIYIRHITKEVGFLQRVLSRILHEADVQAIFRQVVSIFHSQISEAFSNAIKNPEVSSPEGKKRLLCDTQHILGCIRLMPTEDMTASGTPNWGRLDEFLSEVSESEARE